MSHLFGGYAIVVRPSAVSLYLHIHIGGNHASLEGNASSLTRLQLKGQ